MGIQNVRGTLCLNISICQNLYTSSLLSGCRDLRALHILLSTDHADYMLKLQNFYSKDRLKNSKPKLSRIPPHPISLKYLLSRSYLHCESPPIFFSFYFLVLLSIKNLSFSSNFQTTQIPYLFTCSVIKINKNTLLHSIVLFFMFENLINYTVSCNSFPYWNKSDPVR